MHASFEGGSLSLDSVSKMGVSEQLMFRNVADRRTAGAESRNLSLVPSEKPINFQTNQTDLTAIVRHCRFTCREKISNSEFKKQQWEFSNAHSSLSWTSGYH